MDLTFDEDQLQIRRTARDLLSRRSSFEAVRAAADSGHRDPALWDEMVTLGWPGIAIPHGSGGVGLGMMELVILLEQVGYAVTVSPLAPTVAGAVLIDGAGSAAQQDRWLPAIAEGTATGTIALARDGVAENVPDAHEADVIVLVDADEAVLVDAAAATVDVTATIDPTAVYARVELQGGDPLPGDVPGALARAEILLAAQLVGLSQRALDVTVAFVKEREQFGKPVGAFQAVSHRCAEMLLDTERARSALYHAAWAADAGDPVLASASSVAKSTACDAGIATTAAAIQLHGGVGFTWEADVHWLFKRARLLTGQLASAGEHRARVARLAVLASTP